MSVVEVTGIAGLAIAAWTGLITSAIKVIQFLERKKPQQHDVRQVQKHK